MKAWVLWQFPTSSRSPKSRCPSRAPPSAAADRRDRGLAPPDIEILKHGLPALIEGELPFNKGSPRAMIYGTVVKLGPSVDEFALGDRVTVEVHAGCGRCQRCREGMYTSCLNYGYRSKGHRANGFSTDGGSPSMSSTTSTRWSTSPTT